MKRLKIHKCILQHIYFLFIIDYEAYYKRPEECIINIVISLSLIYNDFCNIFQNATTYYNNFVNKEI